MVIGFAEEARERFLKNRSDLIKSKIKRIHFYGDVFASTALFSAITFDSIEAAFDWYDFSFRDPKMIAGFVSWARSEISRFCDVFARQAFRPDLSTEIVAACVVDALENCRRLGYRGLDLSVFLQERLATAVSAALESRATRHYSRIKAALEADDYETSLPVDTPDWPAAFKPLSGHRVTLSLTLLADSALSLAEELQPLIPSKLVSCCATALSRFIDSFSDSYITAFRSLDGSSSTSATSTATATTTTTTNTALVNLAGNVSAIAELIVPGLIERFPATGAALLEGLRARLHAAAEALFLALSEIVGRQLAPSDFSQYYQQGASAELSQWVKDAIPVLSRLARDASVKRKQQLVDGAVVKVIKIFELAFKEDLIKFSSGGLRRFVIDWKLIQRILQKVPLTDETVTAIEELVQEAKSRLSGSDLDAPLPHGPAFEEELFRLEAGFAAFSLDFGNGH